ncbi:MAG TPA: hypothetical protein ENG51_06305 [Deltaproteobacteria bacterium]|nr:MAG: hypothetical protein DRG83_14700 [Deltaproteobacteria bacterium]RLB08393.1 MAG: hypothetical protein DRG59_05125 [Deltaproteobacteria bacterium]HDM76068.1 hypothetical protein [Deltaproteobacteria bacterium]
MTFRHTFIFLIVFISVLCVCNNTWAGRGKLRISRATIYKGDIKIKLGEATDFKTSRDVKSIAVGTDAIADVLALSPRLIRIVGMKPGETNLIIRYSDGYAEEFHVMVNKGYTVEVISGINTRDSLSLSGW